MTLFKNCTEKISYKGKNLNVVLDILNKASKSVDKANVLVYRVIFEERSIEIIASFDIFDKIKK